mmetsp:Transcript_117326/g.373791  ORF Transcript_117326/g.373791 Transcript_117326/m.373791 type:complete len:485 (+) Transcript_117326:1817-3271(+)
MAHGQLLAAARGRVRRGQVDGRIGLCLRWRGRRRGYRRASGALGELLQHVRDQAAQTVRLRSGLAQGQVLPKAGHRGEQLMADPLGGRTLSRLGVAKRRLRREDGGADDLLVQQGQTLEGPLPRAPGQHQRVHLKKRLRLPQRRHALEEPPELRERRGELQWEALFLFGAFRLDHVILNGCRSHELVEHFSDAPPVQSLDHAATIEHIDQGVAQHRQGQRALLANTRSRLFFGKIPRQQVWQQGPHGGEVGITEVVGSRQEAVPSQLPTLQHRGVQNAGAHHEAAAGGAAGAALVVPTVIPLQGLGRPSERRPDASRLLLHNPGATVQQGKRKAWRRAGGQEQAEVRGHCRSRPLHDRSHEVVDVVQQQRRSEATTLQQDPEALLRGVLQRLPHARRPAPLQRQTAQSLAAGRGRAPQLRRRVGAGREEHEEGEVRRQQRAGLLKRAQRRLGKVPAKGLLDEAQQCPWQPFGSHSLQQHQSLQP